MLLRGEHHAMRQQRVEAVAPLAGAQHLDALAAAPAGLETRVVDSPRVTEKLHHLQVEAWVIRRGTSTPMIEEAHVLDDHDRILVALGLQGSRCHGWAAALAGSVLDEADLGAGPGSTRAGGGEQMTFVGPRRKREAVVKLAASGGRAAGCRAARTAAGLKSQRKSERSVSRCLQALGIARIQRLPQMPHGFVQVKTSGAG